MGFFSSFLCYLAGICAAAILAIGAVASVFHAPALFLESVASQQRAADVSAQSERKSRLSARRTTRKLAEQVVERR